MGLAHHVWSPCVILVSFSLLFFSVLPSGWLIWSTGALWDHLFARASKTHSRRCLRWGTFRDLRGCLWPPWSVKTWYHRFYWLSFCVNQLVQASVSFSFYLSFCQCRPPEAIPGSNRGWALAVIPSVPRRQWGERKDRQNVVSKFYGQDSPGASAMARIPYADFSSCKIS